MRLPSFADPTIAQGVLLNQQSFDIRRRMFDTRLDLFPGRRIIPYLAYSRDSGSGTGITDFQTTNDEFAVADIMRDKTDNYRGGARFEFNRFHLTLEQGGTTFKDDQRAYQDNGTNFGNRTTTYLGQRLLLSTLNQAYGVRGDSIYSKALFTANPFSWVNLYGQFLYSLPETNVSYDLAAAGKLVSPLSNVAFVTAQRSFLTSQAKQPHTSGSLGGELRLHRRLRVFESLMTDRFHTTGTLLSDLELLTPTATSTLVISTLGPVGLERLVRNYNRQEVNVMFDLTSWLTLRGGHRYVWGDALVRASDLSQTGPQEQGKLEDERRPCRADLPAGAEAQRQLRLRSGFGGPELLPHQPPGLPEGTCPRQIPGAELPDVERELLCAPQRESGVGRQLQVPEPGELHLRFLDSGSREADQLSSVTTRVRRCVRICPT